MPSISLEETDEARRLIFCMGGHIVTLTWATRGFSNFDPEAEKIGPLWDPGVPLGVPSMSAFKSKFENPLGSPSQCHNRATSAKNQPLSLVRFF